MKNRLAVIALGGNAIKQAEQKGTAEEQFANIDKTAHQLASLIGEGYKLAVTHGNGPQVGSLLIQQEDARDRVPPQPLAVCGAMTQGQIGWMIQNRLAFRLKERNIDTPVCSLVTQVVVDNDDPDFQNPSKPVGPFYTRETALELKESSGYIVKEVKPGQEKGWRRVVPSPEPQSIVEAETIRMMVNSGTVVIASGGGGIPVHLNGDGSLSGTEAVIDKDRAGFILAKEVNADIFVILTDVEKVCLNFGSPDQKELNTVSCSEMKQYFNEGHFLAGSMGPKVQAALRFVEWSGREAIITSLDKAPEALGGKAGTHIIPD